MLTACGSDLQRGINQATDLMYQKQYVQSARLYERLLSRIENSGHLSEREHGMRRLVLDRLGNLNAFYTRDHNAAVGYYEKLARSYEKSDEAFAALATVADIYHHRLGKLEKAIATYQRVVAQFPNRPETRRVQLQVVQAYFQLRNYPQARTEAEFLVNRWPDTIEAAEARFQIANAYYLEKRYTEAVSTLETLIATEPEPGFGALVLFELGNCFQELQDIEKALAYFYAALPDHPNPRLVQAKLRRVRTRWHKVKPAEGIHLPAYVTRRRPQATASAKPAASTTAAPTDNSRVELAPGESNDPLEPVAPPTPADDSPVEVIDEAADVPTAEAPETEAAAEPTPEAAPTPAPKVPAEAPARAPAPKPAEKAEATDSPAATAE